MSRSFVCECCAGSAPSNPEFFESLLGVQAKCEGRVVAGGTGDKLLQELVAVEADVVVVGSHDKGIIERYAWACLGRQLLVYPLVLGVQFRCACLRVMRPVLGACQWVQESSMLLRSHSPSMSLFLCLQSTKTTGYFSRLVQTVSGPAVVHKAPACTKRFGFFGGAGQFWEASVTFLRTAGKRRATLIPRVC